MQTAQEQFGDEIAVWSYESRGVDFTSSGPAVHAEAWRVKVFHQHHSTTYDA